MNTNGTDSEKSGKGRRWLAFVAVVFLAFWGIHLMLASDHGWFWFIPMLLPLPAFLQLESERIEPIAYSSLPRSRFRRFGRALTKIAAALLALLGAVGIYRSSETWLWLSALFLPILALFPGLMKEWEIQDQDKKRQKAERRLRGESSPLRKLLKWAFWLALIGLIWYIGSYFLWVAILG